MRLKRAAEIFLWVLSAAVTSRVADAQKPATSSASKAPTVTRTFPLEGEWSGTLELGETELQLVLHLSKDAQGEWHAKIDSLNQAVYGIEASKVTREEDTVRLEISSVGAKFEGKLLADRRTIRGIWE